MVLGYIVITLFMLSTSFYLISRLNHFNDASASILSKDIPSIKNGEKLLQTLLEQVSSEKKYLIAKEKAFLTLFKSKQGEFIARLESINKSITAGEKPLFLDKLKYFYTKYVSNRSFLQLHPLEETRGNKEQKEIANQIETLYNKYIGIVSKEFILLNYDDNVPLDTTFYGEKEKTLDQLTGAINALILLQQAELFKKMELFQKTVSKSTSISLAIIVIAVLFGAIFSYVFTRSICKPINILKDATERIAQGDLDYRIKIRSKDEFGSLGKSFNKMCVKLAELDQMKTEFISNISHNLKTPLTSIREANELMLDKVAGKISAEQLKLLNIIKGSTLKLIMMINDLLDISRLEAGLMRYNFQHSCIKDIILKSIDDIRFLAEGKKINIQYITDNTSIPKVRLDRDKIAQVMDNIFSNAFKFTPVGGKITVKSCEIESSKLSGSCVLQNKPDNVRSFVQVSISDTGIGIPEEYHKSIFDKFQQVVNKGKGGIKGTGLGLFIAKHIVLDHGGDIWLENNSSNGSTFHFILPLRVNFIENA
ncbi:MAG: HAMP domain-containing histidine kinase [Candidatus Brocadiaceae bacterium]|nr:HAMP domain-containing histidine kinase [Candidatus Brocadiaceae bacterium]